MAWGSGQDVRERIAEGDVRVHEDHNRTTAANGDLLNLESAL
jgi:hypothetical protein